MSVRKGASPGLVVMGSVRVGAGWATRLRPGEGLELPSDYLARWRELRAKLERRRETRRQQRRFRHSPVAYLQQPEELVTQLT